MSNSHLPPLPLPNGIVENQIDCPLVGLSFHILEAGFDGHHQKPLLLLLHGYPELAFSWRKIMLPLAEAGHYVVAVDQRGYGRTTGWDDSPYEQTDMSQFTLTNIVRDMVVLVHALGHREVKSVIGHDFGAVAASMCALMRPDLFKSVVLMSHPYKGVKDIPFDTAHQSGGSDAKAPQQDIQKELAALPEPRKHYKWYNATKSAKSDWENPSQGLHDFLRGYFHLKSADWAGNAPHPLAAWEAREIAKMPKYYIMPLDATMPEAIAQDMKGEDEGKTKAWLSDEELRVYVQEWTRTGFQGGLNWYRAQTAPEGTKDVLLFAGKNIEVPAVFISGSKDWGNHQQPGALEGMPKTCNQFHGVKFIDNAGHWPQQEQPKQVIAAMTEFFASCEIERLESDVYS